MWMDGWMDEWMGFDGDGIRWGQLDGDRRMGFHVDGWICMDGMDLMVMDSMGMDAYGWMKWIQWEWMDRIRGGWMDIYGWNGFNGNGWICMYGMDLVQRDRI